MSFTFDYQHKVWGTAIPEDSPYSLAGLRFHYFLPFIKNKQGRLLEIGCGAGGNLVGIERYNSELKLYGVDIGESAITYGKKSFSKLVLVVGSAEKLPFESNFFDCVCFFDVLEHVVDPAICITESVRVLQPEGIFHAYVPCEGELFSLHGIFNRLGINLKEKTAGHIQKLTRKQLEKMCLDAGLRIVDVRWSCHLLNQIGDLAYYLFLTVSGKRLEQSLESTVGKKESSIGIKILIGIKNYVSWIWYWESRIFGFLPGAGVHITCIKGAK